MLNHEGIDSGLARLLAQVLDFELEQLTAGASINGGAKKAVKAAWPAGGGAHDVGAPKMSAFDFQMRYLGHLLARPVGEPDSRVHFTPDYWQRRLLDAVDRNRSALVCAPTSAGKTFIAYYAIKKILEIDSEGLVVYVVPTASLLMQVSNEIIGVLSDPDFRHQLKLSAVEFNQLLAVELGVSVSELEEFHNTSSGSESNLDEVESLSASDLSAAAEPRDGAARATAAAAAADAAAGAAAAAAAAAAAVAAVAERPCM